MYVGEMIAKMHLFWNREGTSRVCGGVHRLASKANHSVEQPAPVQFLDCIRCVD